MDIKLQSLRIHGISKSPLRFEKSLGFYKFTGMAWRQVKFTTLNTWPRHNWDLNMFYLLRPILFASCCISVLDFHNENFTNHFKTTDTDITSYEKRFQNSWDQTLNLCPSLMINHFKTIFQYWSPMHSSTLKWCIEFHHVQFENSNTPLSTA